MFVPRPSRGLLASLRPPGGRPASSSSSFHFLPPSQEDTDSLLSSASFLSARPCRPGAESYVSAGRGLTLVEEVGESTVVNNINFLVRYEFVTVAQDGRPRGTDRPEAPSNSCDRVFRGGGGGGGGGVRPGEERTFSSPDNVFLFGRGGMADLSCSYTFLGGPGQKAGR